MAYLCNVTIFPSVMSCTFAVNSISSPSSQLLFAHFTLLNFGSFFGPFLPMAKTGLFAVPLSLHTLLRKVRLRRCYNPLSVRASRWQEENFTEMQVSTYKTYLPASKVFQRLFENQTLIQQVIKDIYN